MMTNLLHGAHMANKLFSTIASLRLLLVMCLTLTVSANTWGETINFTDSQLPSGWSGTGSFDSQTNHYHSAKPGYALTSGQYLQTVAYTNITSLTFWGSTSNGGNGQSLTIQYKENGGDTWNNLSSITLNKSAQVQKTVTVTSLAGKTVSLKFSTTWNTAYLDDIEIITASPQSHTITAKSNNTDYGTVSVSGTTITATPNAGYRVKSGDAGYTLTSGTAAVTNNGDNTFSVTPSSDCTITINFEAIPKYTVTLDAGSGTCAASVTEASAGAGVTLPTPTLDCGDWEFAGWAIASVDTKTETEPTLIAAGAYSPTSDITLYAVYSTQEAGDAFTGYAKVATAPDDWSGKYLLSTGSYTATGEYSDKHLTCTNMAPGNVECSSQEFTLSKVGDIGYSILMPNGDYLGYSSSTYFASSSAVPTTTSTTYLWTPSTKGISNVNATARKISTNDAKTDFRPYSNPSSGIVYLYKRVGGSSTTYYHSTPDCGITQPRGSLTY